MFRSKIFHYKNRAVTIRILINICSAFLSLFLLQQAVFAQSDKESIDSINVTPYQYIVSNLRQSIKIFSQNVEDARNINYRHGEAKSLANLGLAQYLNGRSEESTSNYLIAIKIFEELNDFRELAFLYGSFGYQMKRRDLKNAMSFMQKGILIAEQHNLKELLTTHYDNYGVLHEMNNDLDSAFYY